ncbi:MAG: hypothetical protein ACE366_01750 [Bradymonadia bacterium]
MAALDVNGLLPSITAGAWLVGVAVPPREGVPEALSWLRARWSEGDEHLPFTLVHDLGHMLLLGPHVRLGSSSHLPLWPSEERAARLAYEDRLLSQWLIDPGVYVAHSAIAGMSPEWRPQAVCHALGLALAQPLRDLEALPMGNAAHVRNRHDVLVEGLPEGFEGWLQPDQTRVPDPEWVGFVADIIEVCVEALSGRPLFSETDLWEIAHLPDLPSDSARLALRQLHRAAERVGQAGPSVSVHVRRRAQEAPVDDDSADEFPAGGFDAISPRGRIENLVRSELGYAGEAVEIPGGQVDLFDLRFFQSELLYYTRDESPLFDARRRFTCVIDRPSALRHKVQGLPAQTLVMVQGFAMALLADLIRPGMLGPQAVSMDWFWVEADAEDTAVIAEESPLIHLSLAADVAHHRVRFDSIEGVHDERLPRCPMLVFSPLRPPKIKNRAGSRRTLWIQVGEASWRLGDRHWAVKRPEQMRALADEVLVELIG